MTKREAESFTAPYKFGRMGECSSWGHSEWSATGSTEAYHDVPANDVDVHMDDADQQLPHAFPADGMHVEPAHADDAELAAVDAADAADPEPEQAEQQDWQGWSKRWFQRADGSWFYKHLKLKRAAP